MMAEYIKSTTISWMNSPGIKGGFFSKTKKKKKTHQEERRENSITNRNILKQKIMTLKQEM